MIDLNFFKRIITSKHFINFNSRIVVQIVVQLLALVTLPILSKALGVHNFGELAFAMTIISYVGMPMNFGFGQHMLLVISQNKEQKNIISDIISLKLYLAIFFYVLILISGFIFSNNIATIQFKLLLIYGIILFAEALDIGQYYIAKEKISFLSTISAIGSITKAILIIIFIHNTSDIFLAAFFTVSSNIIVTLLQLIFFKDIDYTIKLVPPKLSLLKYYKVVSNFGFAGIFDKAVKHLSPLLIGLYLTKSNLGLYNAANRIISNVLTIFTALTTTFMPAIFRLNRKDAFEKKNLESLNILFYIFLFVGIGFGILLLVFSDLIIKILLTPEFNYSSTILKIWSIMIFTIPVSMFINNMIIGKNKTKVYLYITIIASVLSALITFLAIYSFKFKGAIYSVPFLYLINLLIPIYFIFKNNIFTHHELKYILSINNLIPNARKLFNKSK